MSDRIEIQYTTTEDGVYHVVASQMHALFAECTPDCGTVTADGAYIPVTVRLDQPPVGNVPVKLHRADALVAVVGDTEYSTVGDSVFSKVEWIEVPVDIGANPPTPI